MTDSILTDDTLRILIGLWPALAAIVGVLITLLLFDNYFQSSIADQEPREKPCAHVRWRGTGDLQAVSDFERRRELDLLAKYDRKHFGGAA